VIELPTFKTFRPVVGVVANHRRAALVGDNTDQRQGLADPALPSPNLLVKPFSGRCLFYFNSHGLQAVDQRIKSTAPRKKIVNHSSCYGAYSPRVLNNGQIFRVGLLWPFIENAQSTQSLFADLESRPKGQGYSQAMMPTLDRIT
jgi:hypothetical protein